MRFTYNLEIKSYLLYGLGQPEALETGLLKGKVRDTWVAQWFSTTLIPEHDPGDPGSNPTSGSRCMEPASPSAYVSASLSLSLSLSVTIINKNLKK